MESFTGKFKLLPDENASFEPHLTALGHSDVVKLASKQILITADVVLTDSHYTVFQQTQVGHTRKTIKINSREPFVLRSESQMDGARISCRIENGEIHMFNELKDAKMRNRTVCNGDLLTVETTLLRSGLEPVVTLRKFQRVGPVSEDILNAHNLAVQNDVVGEVVRITPSAIRQLREKEEKRLLKAKKAEERARAMQ